MQPKIGKQCPFPSCRILIEKEAVSYNLMKTCQDILVHCAHSITYFLLFYSPPSPSLPIVPLLPPGARTITTHRTLRWADFEIQFRRSLRRRRRWRRGGEIYSMCVKRRKRERERERYCKSVRPSARLSQDSPSAATSLIPFHKGEKRSTSGLEDRRFWSTAVHTAHCRSAEDGAILLGRRRRRNCRQSIMVFALPSLPPSVLRLSFLSFPSHPQRPSQVSLILFCAERHVAIESNQEAYYRLT